MKLIRIGPSFERRPKNPEQRELRIQSGGNPLRVFYAFDPRRSAILLIRGEQPRDGDWMDIEQAGSGIATWRTLTYGLDYQVRRWRVCQRDLDAKH